jgi:hypothetical protein
MEITKTYDADLLVKHTSIGKAKLELPNVSRDHPLYWSIVRGGLSLSWIEQILNSDKCTVWCLNQHRYVYDAWVKNHLAADIPLPAVIPMSMPPIDLPGFDRVPSRRQPAGVFDGHRRQRCQRADGVWIIQEYDPNVGWMYIGDALYQGAEVNAVNVQVGPPIPEPEPMPPPDFRGRQHWQDIAAVANAVHAMPPPIQMLPDYAAMLRVAFNWPNQAAPPPPAPPLPGNQQP